MFCWGTVAVVVLVSGCSGEGEEQVDDPLDDGVVTQAEYDAAFAAAQRCIEDRGFVSGGNAVSTDGLSKYFLVDIPEGSTALPEEASLAIDECAREHLSQVQRQWLLDNVPEGAERDAMWESLIQCLAENGLPGFTPGTPSLEIMQAYGMMAHRPGYDPAQNHALECMDSHRLLWPEEIPLEPY
ncbi:MAG: hypothetical protein LBD97_08390 [Bifidobacteriaceae bacterium]|nr:hypothetical protein [Bifidobacteriaceae bacterium]